jgi:hypothetical protein
MEEPIQTYATEEYEMIPATPQEIPELTFWPIVLAFAVLFFFWGLITSLIISGVGIVMIVFSIMGWISDLNNE